jgi:hypothetical protein
MKMRLATCQRCAHQGGVPHTLSGAARVRCAACGLSMLVRNVVGPKPCPLPRPSNAARALRKKAAAEVLARLDNPELDDGADDLFRGG